MRPPQPQFSLPTPKYGRRKGSARPLARLRFTMLESAALVMYSTHCIISSTLPLPTLPQTYGAAPSDTAGGLVRRTYAGACTAENRAVDWSADRFALPRVDAHYLHRPGLLRRALEGGDLYLRLRRIGGRARRRVRPDFAQAN